MADKDNIAINQRLMRERDGDSPFSTNTKKREPTSDDMTSQQGSNRTNHRKDGRSWQDEE